MTEQKFSVVGAAYIPPNAEKRDSVEIVLDYLNGMIFGGDPAMRESLRPQAEELKKKWEDEVIRDLYRQFKAQQT